MVKPVKLKIEIDHKSLKEIEDLFDKFKITWDDKVYKKVDDLGDSLDKLSKIMHDVWRQTANKQYQQAKGNINPEIQKVIDTMIQEFEKSTNTIVESIDKTTEAMDKFQGGVSSAGDGMLTFEQQMDKLEASTSKELAIRDKMTDQMRERYRLRRELSEFEEAGRKERQASRGWMNMFGGSGSIGGQLTKIFKPFIKDAFKPMQDVFKIEEFQKTPAGMKAEKLKYNTSPAFPLQRMAGQAAYQKAGIDDPDKARKGGTGMFGGVRKWLGGRAEAHEKGGIAGMMGGAKGMAALGGALIGIKLLQKGVALGIESSPMMQQMLKLWKFGIMMIFRPIGDFFGFFLRPIFVMLLRKFIIPFYQEYLPLMQTMGHDIGTKVVKLLEAIAPLFGGFAKAETYDVAGRMTTGETNEQNLRDAMAQSMADNNDYWERFFAENDGAPEWLDRVMAGLPAIKEQATGATVPVTTAMGGGVVEGDSNNVIEAIADAVDTAIKPYKFWYENYLKSEAAKNVTADIESRFTDSNRFDLTTNKGLLAAQQASQGSTWNINMYNNISGAGTEDVLEKVEEEVGKLEENLKATVQEEIKTKYGRVNPRA